MNRTRHGFTLVEVLLVAMTLPLIAIAISRIFATFIQEIPRATRMVQQNTPVLDMVRQIQEDVDQATGLPDSYGVKRSDEHTLLIAKPDQIVCYEQREGAVFRSTINTTDPNESQSGGTWRFPDAVVTWHRPGPEAAHRAVEIQTLVRQRMGSKLKDRMANSYLFFVPKEPEGSPL